MLGRDIDQLPLFELLAQRHDIADTDVSLDLVFLHQPICDRADRRRFCEQFPNPAAGAAERKEAPAIDMHQDDFAVGQRFNMLCAPRNDRVCVHLESPKRRHGGSTPFGP